MAASSQVVSLDGASPLGTFSSVDPSWTGVYFHALVDSPGVVASTNYLSVFNPVGSGKIAIALGFITGSYSTASVTNVQSLTAFRISAASVGTQIAASAVNRFLTSFPNPSSEVRVANPTVTTTSSKMIGIVPVIGTGAQTGTTVTPTPGASFVFLPGEGIVFNIPQGDTDQLWNMQYIWAEKTL